MITIYGLFQSFEDSSLLRLSFTSGDSGKGVMGPNGLIELSASGMPALSPWRSGVEVIDLTPRKGV